MKSYGDYRREMDARTARHPNTQNVLTSIPSVRGATGWRLFDEDGVEEEAIYEGRTVYGVTGRSWVWEKALELRQHGGLLMDGKGNRAWKAGEMKMSGVVDAMRALRVEDVVEPDGMGLVEGCREEWVATARGVLREAPGHRAGRGAQARHPLVDADAPRDRRQRVASHKEEGA